MSLLHDLWTDALKVGDRIETEFENLRELVDLRLEHLLARPDLVRPLFAHLRAHHPILKVPKLAVVSLYDDVVEVLENEAHFSVVPIYARKMEQTTGDFVLGMANTPQYQREIGLMRQAAHPEDVDRIGTFAVACAAEQIASFAPTGQIDAVGELARRVPTRLLGAYFGTPGPDEATTMRWMRTIFREIFLNLGNDPIMAQEAHVSAKELNEYLDSLIAARKAEIAAGKDVPDDFLCRLLKLQSASTPPVEDETIRRILGGAIVGTVDTNTKAIAQALDQLLSRPLTLKDAHAAARADEDALLARYVFEALRFNPQNPFLIRHCMEPYTVAQGTERATQIPKDSLVIAGTESAMFDPRKFPEPDTFRADRPAENYLHFGAGMHACFGRHFAGALIPGVAKPLLRCQGLRRADGADGELNYDGAFPDRWIVRFDAA
jgi:cytochrome P450